MTDQSEVPYEPMPAAEVVESGEPNLLGKRVATMLSVVGIERIVCVDDLYAVDHSRVIGLSASMSGPERRSLLAVAGAEGAEEMEADDLEDAEVWRSRVVAFWDGLDPMAKLGFYGQVAEVAGVEEEQADATASGALARVFQSVDLITLGLGEWKASKAHLLEEARDTRTLFLFDRNFSAEGGGETEGEGLAQEVIKGSEDEFECWVGLLTHTVSVDGQHSEWRSISSRVAPASPHRFVVISKKTLEPDTARFDEMLRVVLLAAVLQDLLQRVKDAAEQAHRDADQALDAMDPYELEAAVFRSSAVEGVWEPETLVRLYGLAEIRDTTQRLRADDQVHELAGRIRQMVDAGEQDWAEDQRGVTRIRELQRLETLQDADPVNQVHLPLELGDIFERIEGGKRFVLLGPPCDLIVRSEGQRRRNTNTGVLVEIRSVEGASGDEELRLPFFELDAGKIFVADLKRTEVVPLEVLDLCVFRSDGECSFSCDAAAPPRLLPSWEARYGRLKERFTKAMEVLKAEAVDSAVSRSLLNDLSPLGITGPFKITLQPDGLRFGFRRVGRLRPHYANALLTRFANYLSRDAFAHDLTRTS